jgi:hypothetical protein
VIERSQAEDWMPIADVSAFAAFDPLGAILEAVRPGQSTDRLEVRLLVRPVPAERKAAAQRDLTVTVGTGSMWDLIGMMLDNLPRAPRFEPRLQRIYEERLTRRAFEVQGTVAVCGSNREVLTGWSRSLGAVFRSAYAAGDAGLALDEWRWGPGTDQVIARWSERRPSCYLTDAELAGLWHLPSERVLVPGVRHVEPAAATFPAIVGRTRGIPLGQARHRGRMDTVRLPRAELEQGHLAILGRTGTGKSTLVHRINGTLLSEPDRPGIVVLDPHGDLTRDIASQSIPEGRLDDVVLLELGDTEFPVGLPLFSPTLGVSRDEVVQVAFSVLKLIFRDSWSPTRMEDAVFAVTATLCSVPNATVLDVARLLSEPAFRRQILRSVDDPASLQFWADYETLSEGARRELTRPILYRLRSFYRAPAMRNIVGQSSGLDLTELLEERRVLLVSLAGRAIQAEADLLGELLIARLHLALLARLTRARQERRPVFVTVDESQRFAGASLPILLSEGRKLGLGLVLSTQFLDAWGDELAESVLGNVGTLICFRASPGDARRLRSAIRPFSPEHLEDLDRFAAIAKLQVNGQTLPAFRFTTAPVDGDRDESVLTRLQEQSRRRFGRPRQEIEAELNSPRKTDSTPWNDTYVDEE